MGTVVSRLPACLRRSVLVVLVLVALSPQARAQEPTLESAQDAAFQRLVQQALRAGTVPVIVHVAVPRFAELAAASSAVPAQDVSRLQAGQRDDADAALKHAIDQSADVVLAELGGTSYAVNNRYASIPFIAIRASAEALAMLRASRDVIGIHEDIATRLVVPEPAATAETPGDVRYLDNTAGLVGAPTAWSWGYTGKGWYVAIIDTGIRPTHQFFAGKSIIEACFSKGADGLPGAGDCPNGQTSQLGPGSAAHFPGTYTGYDHGTHVAGIAAGQHGSLAGIAKDANLIAIQVFSKLPTNICGGTQCIATWGSDMLAALDWVYSIRGSYRIASANMSIGGDLYASSCDTDPQKLAIDALRNAGIATAIAAGNNGACGMVTTPGCISSAVTVSATTDADTQAFFTNWHPSMVGLFAPGVSIYSSIGVSDAGYGSMGGTSMATPHVAGAWALMKQVVPNGSVTDFLRALRAAGVPITSTCDGRQTSIPRLRVNRAIAGLVRFQLVLQTSAFGTTDPAPGTYAYAPGTVLQITATAEPNAAFVGWSGAASGAANPLTVQMDADKAVTASFQFIYAPNASGRQVLNQSFSQGEYINLLAWQGHAANRGLTITKYRIYTMAGSTRTLLVELPATQSEYQHRHVARGSAQYAIVAVTHDNREGAPALVVIQ